MKNIPLLALLLLLPTLSVANEEEPELGTAVIGSQEAPSVLNVVPWKDREAEVERPDPTSALLDRMLEPLDQDVLRREMEYYQLHQVPVDEAGK